jgi:CubicO group peptidase (beta-lactamase class C family)
MFVVSMEQFFCQPVYKCVAAKAEKCKSRGDEVRSSSGGSMRIKFCAALCAQMVLWCAGSSPAQEIASKPVASKKVSGAAAKEHLEVALPELMKKATIPGLEIALIEHGATYWLGSFGVKNSASQLPVTSETVFEAASLSKTVFAYGVLKLVDQGKLDLDSPLTKYLPKPYIDGDERLKLITARYVLSHRTGFPNWRGDGNALTIRFTPGDRFSYSGEGFVYLQKVVEQITGKSLDEYMRFAVFEPLGMTSSSYVWRNDYEERKSSGHDVAGQPVERRKPKEANAAASLQTTATDYARFLDAILSGVGLKRETVKMMEEPQVAVDPACTNCTDRTPKELSKEIFWGLGWGIAKTGRGEILWHWGDNGAFKCFVAVNVKQKDGVILFTNSENGLGIAPEVTRLAMGENLSPFGWLKYDRYDSPAMQFSRALREGGTTAAIGEFEKDLQSGKIPEETINSAGYRLLGQKKTSQAIELFQLNVRLHPDSWNVYDSLAEAQMNNGEKELAIKNYEKSLALNPNNPNGEAMLKKLRAN